MLRFIALFSALPCLFLLAGCPEQEKIDPPPLDAGEDTDAGGRDGGETEPCDGSCAGDTPFCNEGTDECVECLGADDCTGDAALCHENSCVECVDTIDCESPDASVCDAETNTCVGCETNDDCVHIEGLGICDDNACVECSPADTSACAENKLCNALTNTCSEEEPGGAGATCAPCIADAHCPTGRVCVQMAYDGEPIGHFCLWDAAQVPGGDCTTEEPYTAARPDVATIDGNEVDAVCVPALSHASCPALRDYRTTDCEVDGTPDDSLCGIAPDGSDPRDGYCIPRGAGFQCTVSCSAEEDCPDDFRPGENDDCVEVTGGPVGQKVCVLTGT